MSDTQFDVQRTQFYTDCGSRDQECSMWCVELDNGEGASYHLCERHLREMIAAIEKRKKADWERRGPGKEDPR